MKTILKQVLLLSILLTFACKTANLKKDKASNTIDQLQEGMLLVKLKTSENKIRKYKEMGNMEKANQAIKEQQTLNANIITSFKENFDFCPVYFFHSNDVANIKNNDFDGSIFQTIGEDLKNPPSADTYFLVSEVDFSYQDELVGKSGEKEIKVAGTGAVTALVIRDKENFQIAKPFPYRIKLLDTQAGNLKRGVTKLNKKLKEFDNKMEVRKLKRSLRQ